MPTAMEGCVEGGAVGPGEKDRKCACAAPRRVERQWQGLSLLSQLRISPPMMHSSCLAASHPPHSSLLLDPPPTVLTAAPGRLWAHASASKVARPSVSAQLLPPSCSGGGGRLRQRLEGCIPSLS